MASEAKLLGDFPPVTTEQWMEAVKKDLKGADFEKKLLWQTDEGIPVRPFYRDEDLAGMQHLGAAPGQFPYVRGTKPENDWEILDEPVEASPDTVAAHRYQDAGATVVQELAYAVAEGIERLATAPERGQTAEDAAGAIAFSFAIGTNFFFEIAKLRAARLLWSLVCESFGCSKCAARMTIHARTSRWDKTVYDPYVNILRGTTEAMSAAIGGCDTLAIASYDAVHRKPAADGVRLAVNTQLILKQEAWFDRTVDPAGGSYYVEVLTDSIAREAWKLVKEIEAAGGFTKAQTPIKEAVAKSREKKLALVAVRKESIVGTNTYPNPKECMLGHLDEAALKANRPRAADQFENMRFAAEASGETRVFLLAEIGDLKMRKARSAFVRNFLGCAGFGVQVKKFGSVDDVANAAVQGGAAAVVLCSSDPEYAQLAPALIAALKNAGSTAPVIIAGYPQDSLEQLKTAGVADFIHMRSNAIETLRAWQARLGIKE